MRRERRAHRVYDALDPVAGAAFTAPVRQVCDLLAEVAAAATGAPGRPHRSIPARRPTAAAW